MMFGGNMVYFQRMLLKKTYISIISFMKITSLLCVKNKSKNLELIKFDLIAKTIFLRFWLLTVGIFLMFLLKNKNKLIIIIIYMKFIFVDFSRLMLDSFERIVQKPISFVYVINFFFMFS